MRPGRLNIAPALWALALTMVLLLAIHTVLQWNGGLS